VLEEDGVQQLGQHPGHLYPLLQLIVHSLHRKERKKRAWDNLHNTPVINADRPDIHNFFFKGSNIDKQYLQLVLGDIGTGVLLTSALKTLERGSAFTSGTRLRQ